MQRPQPSLSFPSCYLPSSNLSTPSFCHLLPPCSMSSGTWLNRLVLGHHTHLFPLNYKLNVLYSYFIRCLAHVFFGFMSGLLFDSEDEGDIFLRNFGLPPNYMVLQLKIPHLSNLPSLLSHFMILLNYFLSFLILPFWIMWSRLILLWFKYWLLMSEDK
jgi:hypothetical protein